MDKQLREEIEETIREGILQNLPVEVITDAILHNLHSRGVRIVTFKEPGVYPIIEAIISED